MSKELTFATDTEDDARRVAYASTADRLVALALDLLALSIAIFVAAGLAAAALGAPVKLHDGATSLGAAVEIDKARATLDALIAAALGAAYCVLSWRRGGTLGQRALALSVARADDGGAPGLRAATLRWLTLLGPFSAAAIVDPALGVGAPIWLPVVAWYAVLLVDCARRRDGRALHDRLARTAVTRHATPVAWTAQPAREHA